MASYSMRRRLSWLLPRSASNLLVLFARSLMHKLRFEPYMAYDDMEHLAAHLYTFAGKATQNDRSKAAQPAPGFVKEMGNYLGLAVAASNPRKALKRATSPLGNTPLEVLNYLAKLVDFLVEQGKLPVAMQQTLTCK
jgi:ion channel-forming bestrophin family protein